MKTEKYSAPASEYQAPSFEEEVMFDATSVELPGVSNHERVSDREYLHATKVTGVEGDQTTAYNKYTINGKEIIFHSTREVPNPSEPTSWRNQHDVDISGMPRIAAEMAKREDSNEQDATWMVPATPEGILAATRDLYGESNKDIDDMLTPEGTLKMNDKTHLYLDMMIASTMYDDKLNQYKNYHATGMTELSKKGDGFAQLVMMYGEGDDADRAQDNISRKLEKYYQDMNQAEENRKARMAAAYEEGKTRGIESLKMRDVVLVHSTSHEVERDDAGNVVLYPASAKREDRLPRSSIHFTANGEVTSHMAGQWESTNRLIVTSLEDAYESNGSPRVMSEVDTWFTTDPTEPMTLPNARVIEPMSELEGDVLVRSGDEYQYRTAAEYSESERKDIEDLAKTYEVELKGSYSDILRECALRAASRELGAMQSLDIGMHYGDNDAFNNAYRALGEKMGAPAGLHVNFAEHRMEGTSSASGGAPSLEASIQANRTLAWSGQLSTRVSAQDNMIPSFGSGII